MEQQFKVLLIEDNPGDAFLIKFYLEESSAGSEYELEHTEFLEEGLKKLDDNTYDVVLLDLGLPDSNGLDTLQKVLDHSPEVLVIVLTGLTDEETGVKTVQMGAQDFLVKGQFDGRVLNSSIRYAFERFKLNQQLKEYSNQLARSRRQFEETQRMANLGYWELDIETEVMEMTNELLELLGIQKEQFNSSIEGFLELINQDEKEEVRQHLDSAKKEEKQVKIDLNLKNGEYLHCACKPYYDEDGNFSKVVGIIRKQN